MGSAGSASTISRRRRAGLRYDELVEERRQAANSVLCVGLDPELTRLPAGVSRDPTGVLRFLSAIVEATADLACAYKPNFGFYEALGSEGMAVLRELVARIPGDTPVIADAKRSDLGNSARMYAASAFEAFGCDAITVSPYQGRDSVEAYLAYPDRGVYLLARTSNRGSADFQELLIDGEPLYLRVVREALGWQGAGTLGFVAGATASEQLAAIRRLAPEAPLLIPGIGAQGGDLAASIRYGRTAGGGGVLLSASRSILYASDADDFADAAQREAERLMLAARAEGAGEGVGVTL